VHPLLADPWIAERVEAAVAPYAGRLSPGEISWMRDQLAEVLASDEKAKQLLRRARPVVVEQSGEVVRGAGAPVTSTPAHPVTMGDTPKPPGDDRPGLAAGRPKAAG
jgi:hypothetical protein